MQRPSSTQSHVMGDDALPQPQPQPQPQSQSQSQSHPRGDPLKKKSSLRRSGSLGRSNGRPSMQAGSVRSLASHSASDLHANEKHSAFYCPVPTSGSPTEVLVQRFQHWRKILRDLISYFREIESQHEQKIKSIAKLSNVAASIAAPPSFLRTDGIDEGGQIIRSHLRNAMAEVQHAKEVMVEVVLALTGLRSDLQQKIKEIKHLSADFKNSVEREMENTSKSVRALAVVLEKSGVDALMPTGKQDPYLLRLAVDRQIERQIDEENYLHQAYINLESSGKELEAIIVGEIQKAYNAYAGILKREADHAYGLAEDLQEGPVSMPKDREWTHFVATDNRVIDPTVPLRSVTQIRYPGQNHHAALEIRAGLLERKSKYLKSYTAGWYVLSTTHIHEFKSADKTQPPVMSLFLPDQKLGSHSIEGGSSNKFVLKGRQTGAMHRGHTWVFRAESHDAMMVWYEDIKALTEKSPEERSDFVRAHSRRSLSLDSSRRSASSDGLDEEDEEPFRATQDRLKPMPRPQLVSRRSQPGGRFPSDIQVNAQRGLLVPPSPSAGSIHEAQSEFPETAQAEAQAEAEAEETAAEPAAEEEEREEAEAAEETTEALTNGTNENIKTAALNHIRYGSDGHILMRDIHSQAAIASHQALFDSVNPYTSEPLSTPQKERIAGDDDLFTTSVMDPHDSEAPNGEIRDGEARDGEAHQTKSTNDDPSEQHEQAYHTSTAEGMYSPSNDESIVPRTSLVLDSGAMIGSERHKDDDGLQIADASHALNGQRSSGEHDDDLKPPAGDDLGRSTAMGSSPHIPGEFPGVSVGAL